jgi:hypothetical protein
MAEMARQGKQEMNAGAHLGCQEIYFLYYYHCFTERHFSQSNGLFCMAALKKWGKRA